MPRLLSTAALAAIAAATVSPIIFVEIAFANETLYMFGGVGTITPTGPASNPAATFPYGQTWTGLGWLGKISGVPQTTKIQAQNVTLSLSGIPSELMLDASQHVRMNGVATIWLGFFDSNGNLILDPVQLFSGALDVPTLTDGGETCDISITCENPLLTLNQAPNRRFEDCDQQIYTPGDLGFSFVDALANTELFWPSPFANSTPYPVTLAFTPSGADIAVGGSQSMTVRVTYSDGSYYQRAAGGPTGSGPLFIISDFASSDPSVARIDPNVGTNFNVIGVSPGTCNIMVRIPAPASGSPNMQLRAVTSLIVHS
jgi:hypothetical protein